MKFELKACPFCGADSKANIVHVANRHTCYRVVCGKCGASGKGVKIKDKTEIYTLQKSAVDAWNRRAYEQNND